MKSKRLRRSIHKPIPYHVCQPVSRNRGDAVVLTILKDDHLYCAYPKQLEPHHANPYCAICGRAMKGAIPHNHPITTTQSLPKAKVSESVIDDVRRVK